ESIHVWGRPSQQFSNGSKLLQMIRFSRSCQTEQKGMKFPKSYVVKGSETLLEQILTPNSMSIVKSLSAIRSRVTTDATFKNWNTDALKNLPTLFQECVTGADVR